jgi:Multidrug resistance efflux pump
MSSSPMLGRSGRIVPSLREDLALLPGPTATDGSPTWTIHDPSTGRYHRIGLTAFEILSRWQSTTVEEITGAIRAAGNPAIGRSDVERLLKFLDDNHLLQRRETKDVSGLIRAADATRMHPLLRLLHAYLFIRFPLVRPDAALAAWSPRLSFLFSRTTLAIVLLALVAGISLVSRRWDTFLATAADVFSLTGLIWLGAALAVTKSVHELGHALTAKRFGCRVPTMGVAVMVFYPVLYTDVSDVWRLPDRRRRILVGAAGMIAEACLAAFVLLCWSFLPDGPARTAAFSLVTVSLAGTVLINASPFMRFDGYYLLSDALGIENLQTRAFAMARWHLREFLFGLGVAPPEQVAPRRRVFMVAYAYATWAYRLLLYIGLALLVYYMFFKLVGVALFIVEIWWFILIPLWRELKTWWQLRSSIRLNPRICVTAGTSLAVILALALPWRTDVQMFAMLRPADYRAIFVPAPARIDKILVEQGMQVEVGQVLIVASAPDLDHELEQVSARLAMIDTQIARGAASAEARRALPILQSQRASLLRRRSGLEEIREHLVLRSPVSGTVVDLDRTLREGLWVDRQKPLAFVADLSNPHVIAFLPESDVFRLDVGAKARFIPADPLEATRELTVREIGSANVDVFDIPALASVHGGPVATRRDTDGRLLPSHPLYRVELYFVGAPPNLMQTSRGLVVAQGAPQSPARAALERITAVLIRESGW